MSLRIESDDDWEFVVGLYASTRADELAPVPWPVQAKADFLRSQCELQRDHYRRYYPGANFLIIERNGVPIGRFYVHETASEIRLMDIVLAHGERGKGIGTPLIVKLLESAETRGVAVTLHVEPDNPAQRMYARLGFRFIEERGAYHFLRWDPAEGQTSA